MTHVATRTCAGCGRKRPQTELLRFAAHEGRLVPAPHGTRGRGVYTCPRLMCFERARDRRAFARTLHTPVVVDPELSRL
ncbi:MAG TPA: DUF448 domain-containing protein [Gaiellaceae bacterium]|nr:DUF448 domain-containing protein [Gaiellaceae bacterium]